MRERGKQVSTDTERDVIVEASNTGDAPDEVSCLYLRPEPGRQEPRRATSKSGERGWFGTVDRSRQPSFGFETA